MKSVKDAGDVDFVMGAGNNINSSGNLTNLEKLAVSDATYMKSGRYIAVLNKDNPNEIAKLLYKFISGVDYPTTGA